MQIFSLMLSDEEEKALIKVAMENRCFSGKKASITKLLRNIAKGDLQVTSQDNVFLRGDAFAQQIKEGQTLEQIAESCKISKERVRQIILYDTGKSTREIVAERESALCQKILKMKEKGDSIQDIADELLISYVQVQRRLKKLKLRDKY
jgi:DNA-binding CsgD family transcriptional regulator